MTGHSSVQEFIDAYRTAFEALDATTVADLFAYPCHVTGDDDDVAITTVPGRAAWIPTIERILLNYRVIGVSRVEVREVRVDELTPRLARALVTWRLRDEEGRSIYDFEASYTLARFGDGWRIAAIAHNETPRLRAAVTRRRPAT